MLDRTRRALRLPPVGLGLAAALLLASLARPAAAELRVSAAEALRRARVAAPDLAVAQGHEAVARADVEVAGVLPNPSVIVGGSTQAAKLSVGASVPLLVFGQRGASVAASRADLETARVDGEVAWADVRAGVARAYVTVWLAEERARARHEGTALAARLDDIVRARVDAGASPEVDALRTRAERLKAEADERESDALVDAASAQLAFYLGTPELLRADGPYAVPDSAPALAALGGRVDGNPSVRRETSDARAADARADKERALVRPVPVLDFGADIGDPTLPGTNYRAQLAVEVPLLTHRGPQVDRERANAAAARARASLERARARASLETAYHTFVGADARAKTLRDGVVVAADAAALAIEESYTRGRAPLVAVLDAARARLDARVALAEALATRAAAWIDVERAVGGT